MVWRVQEHLRLLAHFPCRADGLSDQPLLISNARTPGEQINTDTVKARYEDFQSHEVF